MIDCNVVPLFISEEELHALWAEHDCAVRFMHHVYRTDEPDETVRFNACLAVEATGTAFRRAFARARPRSIG